MADKMSKLRILVKMRNWTVGVGHARLAEPVDMELICILSIITATFSESDCRISEEYAGWEKRSLPRRCLVRWVRPPGARLIICRSCYLYYLLLLLLFSKIVDSSSYFLIVGSLILGTVAIL